MTPQEVLTRIEQARNALETILREETGTQVQLTADIFSGDPLAPKLAAAAKTLGWKVVELNDTGFVQTDQKGFLGNTTIYFKNERK